VHNMGGDIYFNGKIIDKHWFTSQELVDLYQEESKNKTTGKALTNALSMAGSFCVQARVIRPEKGDAPYPTRLWCIRNIPKWRDKRGRQKAELFSKSVRENYEGQRVKFSKIAGKKGIKVER